MNNNLVTRQLVYKNVCNDEKKRKDWSDDKLLKDEQFSKRKRKRKTDKQKEKKERKRVSYIKSYEDIGRRHEHGRVTET